MQEFNWKLIANRNLYDEGFDSEYQRDSESAQKFELNWQLELNEAFTVFRVV